jgi:O-acetyl-ADP-ribose deacetylase (regulator of RNase III)
MIEHLSGDVLEYEAKALVSPVNCVGVMGKGLSVLFKQRYPTNYIFISKRAEKVACAQDT